MDVGNDALAKAFASIAAVGERVGTDTLGAYELQVFIKRNFGHSAAMVSRPCAPQGNDGRR